MPEKYMTQDFLTREVVLDLRSMYVCLGTLIGENEHYFILENADVHDLRDTETTREKYVLDSKSHGIRPNRARVLICKQEVVGISLLGDVIA